jgi:hypothetical protein
MAYTYHELKEKTLAQLREIAGGIPGEGIQGYSQLNKDHLLPAICRALGIDAHEHHEASGIDKAGIKAKIRMLKLERDAALAEHNAALVRTVRRHIHHLNRQIRSHVH